VVTPCVTDPDVAGNSGAALLGVGVVTSLLVGPVMERTRRYALLQQLFLWGSAAGAVFVLAVNQPGKTGLIIGAW
jgi:hypothetical protein